MEFHQQKLENFCRFCKQEGLSNPRKKNSFENIVRLQHPNVEIDFENEDPSVFPMLCCGSCSTKLNSWFRDFNNYEKFVKKKGKMHDGKPFSTNRAIIPSNNILSGLPCSMDQDCNVCSYLQPTSEVDSGPSPSKVTRMSPSAIVSPSDKVTKKSKIKQSPKAGLASIKLDFEKGSTGPQGKILFKQPSPYKIYSESKENKAFDIQDCVETDQANILKCQFCNRFPSDPVMSKVCGHIFCKICFVNFKSSVKSSCPILEYSDK